jgi:hypothetical protein
MVTRGPSGVPSRTGVRLGNEERSKRLQIAARNASAYQRRVAAKGACGGAQPVACPCGPPVIGKVHALPVEPAANERESCERFEV